MKALNLKSTGWKLSNIGSRPEIKDVQMNIPGDNYSALMRANLIPDPYYGMQEKECQWVGKDDWCIERTFTFTPTANARQYLCMDMVDTFFKAYLNGVLVGEGHNYFRIWRFDITEALKEGENTLRIEFESSEKNAILAAEKLPYPIPVSAYDMYSPHRNLVRKIQCHSGWDWGPCLMVSGIYGNIFIDSVHEGFINSVGTETVPVEEGNYSGRWHVSVKVRYTSFEPGKKTFLIELIGNGQSLVKSSRQELKEGLNEFEVELEIEKPELWKSADQLKEEGLKENKLYLLRVCSMSDHKEDSIMEKNVGIRTLKLEAIPDEKGCSLFYRLNGRPIFAKGANWIPIDSLPERWTESRYRYFLQTAADSNMNSLRFWGGGQYESEMCFNICDKLGLIIWHDCMFACGLYPTDNEFLEDVEREIEDNVYRLQSHPSLAVWCGNNENYGALNWYEESRRARDRYIVDYDRLNHGVVEKTVKRCDPSRTWWPSSPCAGPDTFGDNWHNDSEGDMHFWSVWHEKKDMEHYLSIKPRFVSEFGYESFPSLEGTKEFAGDDQLNLTSPVMEWHQRSPGGNSIMLENFSRYFRIPNSFQNMLYLSQVQQAMAVKTAVDYWRSLRPHCMGATYWQINDIWPVASWSSLEYSGKWKLLHYQAKRFFEPLCFSLYKKEGKVFASIVNETMSKVHASVKIQLMDFDGNIKDEYVVSDTLESDSAKLLWQMEIDPETADTYFIQGTMTCTTESKALMESGIPLTQSDTLFPARWKKCDLKQTKVSYEAKTLENGNIQITLNATKPAFFTQLDLPGHKGIFSDNMFTLLPGNPVTVTFAPSSYGLEEPAKAPTIEEFNSALEITTLRDTY